MDQIGPYTVVETRRYGVEFSLLRVKHPSQHGRFFAKVYKPIGGGGATANASGPVTRANVRSTESAVRAFIEIAAVLQKVASPNWVPCTDVGRFTEGA